MPLLPNCSCPSDSAIQTLAKVNHNLILLFSTMSSNAWKGNEVSLTGCGCSEPQMLAALNGNIISFFNWLAENPIGGGGNDSSGPLTNTTGNQTITPTAANYYVPLTIGGAARTTNIIAAGSPAEGDMIDFTITLPATAGIVLNIRNATAGGTLLDTFTTDGVTLAWRLILVYESGAWTKWASQQY